MDKGPIVLKDKPMIGVSACCFGCPVRYNGRSIDLVKNIGREKGSYTWCPVCPESAAGLGVPRDPIRIAGPDGRAVWSGEARVISRGGCDVSEALLAGARESLTTLQRAGVRVFFYMDGSPSCGVYRTTLRKQNRGKPPGVFGALLDDAGFFLVPALDLQSPIKWWDWRRRMLAYLWISDTPLSTRSELYEAWYRIKFLCQELDDPFARSMGRQLAALKGPLDPAFTAAFRRSVGDVLRRPSTLKRITSSLWKNYTHYRKLTGRPLADVQPPSALRNVTTIARELLLMEREASSAGILFGSSPVLYAAGSSQRRRREDAADERTDTLDDSTIDELTDTPDASTADERTDTPDASTIDERTDTPDATSR